MKAGFINKILVSIAVCCIILLVEGLLTFTASNKYIEVNRWMNHTHNLIHEYERALRVSLDATVGERGYVITGDEIFLAPFRQSLTMADSHFVRLRALSDQPEDQARVDTMVSIFRSLVSFYGECIDLRKAGKVEEAILLLRTGTGVRLENDLREVVHRARNKEEKLLASKVSQNDRDINKFRSITIVLLATIFLFIIGIYIALVGRARVFRKSEEAFIKTISDYKFAIDESSIVAISDKKGIIRHVNDGFCRISGYSKEELIGKDYRIINSGHHSKDFIWEMWSSISLGQIWKGQIRNKAKDGTLYWVEATIIPFNDEQGKPFQFLDIRTDITQRKKAEEELLKMNTHLEDLVEERTLELTHSLEREKELNEMKSRFVSIASHEFRTPLSAILSSTSLIESYSSDELKDKRQKHIDRIKASVKNLVEILNDFLSLDKLEQGKMEISREKFNLYEFSNDIIEEVSGLLKSGQSIEHVYHGDPEVFMDKKVLKNIFLNLLSNAIKYSLENKKIFLQIHSDDSLVSVIVRDQGLGIPAEDQKNLFAKFHRAKNVTNIQGTGLGLNIVKKYVELLQGTITFTSKEGTGTTFELKFPRLAEKYSSVASLDGQDSE